MMPRLRIWILLLVGWCAAPLLWAGAYDDFFIAIKQDNTTAVRGLLQRGLDPNTINPEGAPAVMMALRISSFKVAQLLLEHPQLEVNALTQENESPLMLAALKGQLKLVELLLQRGADVNKTGWTALHYAATGGHVQIMELLLDRHAYIDARSPNGTTPLMMAAMYGTKEAVELLLVAGADWTLNNEQNLTAMQFAQKANKTPTVQAISAFIRAQNQTGVW
jgi:uncharacterized protein